MGQNDGVKNERALIESLNGKTHSKLNKNLKKFIKALFPGCKNSDVIKCEKQEGNAKGDLKVSIEKNTKSVSVKVGKSLSIHQESFSDFKTEFLEKNSAPSNVQEILKIFITHGKNYQEKICPADRSAVQDFLSKHKQSLVERFLKRGRKNIPADYIYYGNCSEGYTMKIDEAIKKFSFVKSSGYFNIGGISLQAYCRDCGGNHNSSDLQAKISISALRTLSEKNIYYQKCDD
jgi:hypothetical protein